MFLVRNRPANLKILRANRFWKEVVQSQSVHLHVDNKKETIPVKSLQDGPGLKEFLIVGKNLPRIESTEIIPPYLHSNDYDGRGRKIFFETYGCQMNVNDTEIVLGVLKKHNYEKCENVRNADIILVMTCAIREGAETKIWNRLKHLTAMKRSRSARKAPLQIGVLGCMAERLKTALVEKEKWVDIVAGPDSYKDLPRLLAITRGGQSAVNVLLSLDETYADIMPIRLNENSVTAFASIMRGCDNMCSYCIVPFTRGRERSRPVDSIENEVRQLYEQGVREVTLLGQNVNSYRDLSVPQKSETKMPDGFRTVYKTKVGGLRFAELLERVAQSVPEMRIRFTSPHPKDFPDDVLFVIKKYPNICKNLHLPAQSGNSNVLERMRRGYTREAYIELVKHVRNILPDVTLSSDFICGFCGETDSEFADTISLLEEVKYNVAFLFAYSMREKTTAHRRNQDDVPEKVKQERLLEMIKVFRRHAEALQAQFVGKTELVLVEGKSKKSESELSGRNDGNIKVIIPREEVPTGDGSSESRTIQPGDYIAVRINQSNSQILKGVPLYHTTLTQFYENKM